MGKVRRCLTCNQILKPQTKAPRVLTGAAASLAGYTEKDRQARIAKQKQEVADGLVGFLKEGFFCNATCAAWFGRAAAEAAKHSWNGQYILDQTDVFLIGHSWVADRRAKAK